MISERHAYLLTDIIELIGGGTPKSNIPEYWNGDIPWLSVKDFNNDDRYVYSTEKSITQAGLDNSSTKMLAPNDIIISARGTVGELAMIPSPMAFNQSCYGIRGRKDIISQPYLYYFLKDSIRLLKSQTHGSVFDTITRDTFANIEINLPPIDAQKAIAAVLSALDDKIELNNRIYKNLEAQAQAIFKSWFVDFEPFRDGEFVDSELGPIPKGWRAEPLSSLLYMLKKTESFPNTKEIVYEHYSIPAFDDRKYPSFDLSLHIKSNKTILEEGCFLVSKLNPSFKRLWRPFIITNHAVTSTEFVALKPLQSDQFSFCYAIADSDGFYSYLTQNTTGSTGSRQRVSPTTMLNYRIAVPPEEWIRSFCKIVDNMYQLNDKLLIENQTLAALRDTLLPKLMSGEVRVPLEV